MDNYIKRLFTTSIIIILLIIIGCTAIYFKTKSVYVWIFGGLSTIGIIINMTMIYQAFKKNNRK